MRADLLDDWLTALESGDYDQVRGQLGSYNANREDRHQEGFTPRDAFCCLGVLCDVALDYDDAPIELVGVGIGVDGFAVRARGDSSNFGAISGSMPPPVFNVWAGETIDTMNDYKAWDYSFDVADEADVVDWEADYALRWAEPFDHRGVTVELSLPGLNDSGFTFAQIADIIRWAEVRDDVTKS